MVLPFDVQHTLGGVADVLRGSLIQSFFTPVQRVQSPIQQSNRRMLDAADVCFAASLRTHRIVFKLQTLTSVHVRTESLSTHLLYEYE